MRLNLSNSLTTFKQLFDDFLISSKAKGLAEKTLKSYASHAKTLEYYMNLDVPVTDYFLLALCIICLLSPLGNRALRTFLYLFLLLLDLVQFLLAVLFRFLALHFLDGLTDEGI